jgi:hypothetical protein
VSDAVVTVNRDGVDVPGSMLETDGQVIQFAFDSALSEPGRYEVVYEMISFDRDETDASFFFDYVPDAPPPVRLGQLDAPPRDLNLVPILASIFLAGCLVGLAFVYLSRVEAGRREATDGPDEGPAEGPGDGGHAPQGEGSSDADSACR